MVSTEHARFQIVNTFMVTLPKFCLVTILDYVFAVSASRCWKCGLKHVRAYTSMTIFEWRNFQVRWENWGNWEKFQKRRCTSVPKNALASINAQTQHRCDWYSEIVCWLPKCAQDDKFEHLRSEGSEPYTMASKIIYDHFTLQETWFPQLVDYTWHKLDALPVLFCSFLTILPRKISLCGVQAGTMCAEGCVAYSRSSHCWIRHQCP